MSKIIGKWIKDLNGIQGLFILGIIWLIGALIDRLWFALDHSVPPWDQADYLNGGVVYWQAFKSPEWFNGDWWRSLWLLSSKIPPLTYILTAPFLGIFGVSEDAATLVMLVFSALLLLGVYGLGVILFDVSVGLWAAGLCLLMPGLYYYRLEFLLDFPLTSIVTFSFYLLTFWYFHVTYTLPLRQRGGDREWGGDRKARMGNVYPFPQTVKGNKFFKEIKNNFDSSGLKAIAFGLSLGLAFMVKQTALFFLFSPLLWVLITVLIRRQWGKLAQFFLALGTSLIVFFPWYRTNWLLTLTAGKRATIDSALIEGDPSLSSLDAWTYYFKVFPYFLSWPLLLVPCVGFLLGLFYWQKKVHPPNPPQLLLVGTESQLYPPEYSTEINPPAIKNEVNNSRQKWIWLGVFLIGGYLLSSLNINKDTRYILPLYPVISLILAVGLLSWRGRWRHYVRWGTIGVATVAMLFNLFPLGGEKIADLLSPKMQHQPYLGKVWPNEEVVTEIVKTSPYIRSTLGVLPSTPELNQHNFSFYGGKYDKQVFGRQVGVRKQDIEADARSIDWFITKTGDQGSIPEAQPLMTQRIEKGADFKLNKSWTLPDKSTLSLYHRRQPAIEVKPLSKPLKQVQLDNISIPETSPPGVPIPVTYTWSGPWQDLEDGILLLSWENPKTSSRWLHDHGVGMGNLQLSDRKNYLTQPYQVIERTAMLPDQNLPPGEYSLKITYLNRQTGATYPIYTPPIQMILSPNAKASPAPELDLVTQLRNAAKDLNLGIKGVEPIFALTGRINQYDAKQDYVKQADLSLSERLKAEKNLNWAYGVTISRVLQQDVKGAIKALQETIQLNPNNPYHYAYLAFVYLYDWQPYNAQKTLDIAFELNPNIPELKTLNGVAALMQGHFFRAWEQLK